MTIQKSEALVLKTNKFRDTSLITTFFTADFGKIKALSKGVRKERSSVIAHYEPFSHVEITFYEKTKSDIHFLSECSLVYFFPKIRSDFEKISWASYLVELVDVVLPLEESNQRLFRLLLDILHKMEEESPSRLVAIFEIKALLQSGSYPSLDSCLRCGRKDVDGHLSFLEGGLFCEGCWNRSSESMFISRDLIHTVRFLAESEFTKSLEWKILKESEEEIHRLAFRWIRYRYEKNMAAVRFLRNVDIIHTL